MRILSVIILALTMTPIAPAGHVTGEECWPTMRCYRTLVFYCAVWSGENV